jgi:hypothetical protein
MSITDALNLPSDELFWMNRTALHEQYYGPFFSDYDPYRNIRYAQAKNGWIIDYCHCPLEKAVHPNKDCSAAHLRERFEAVLSEGGSKVWCANPDEVMDYHVLRRHTRVEVVREDATEQSYRLTFEDLPGGVISRALTLEIAVPAAWCQNPVVTVDGMAHGAELVTPGCLRLTVSVTNGSVVSVASPYPAHL